MRRWGVLVLALSVATGWILGGGATAQTTVPDLSCTASTKMIGGSIAREIRYRLSCPFEITNFSVIASKRITRASTPIVEDGDAGDSVSCTKSRPKAVACEGAVGADGTVVGRLRLKRDPCAKPKLSARFSVRGGEDCDDGEVCPMVGYSARVSVPTPSGC